MSVLAPGGFVAAGVHCGIKEGPGLDLALVATDDGAPVPAAAVFTTNRARAAPVQVSMDHLRASGARAAAVVLNSGNANAATGEEGREVARRTCRAVAEGLGCRTVEVLVCSTGLIGIPLPAAALEQGTPEVVAALSSSADAGADAADAIRTTDTVRKEVVVAADGFTVGGMAKGAAMLSPAMATMLAVLTTDAAVESEELALLMPGAVADSFNALSVDGCTSTNDTVIVLAGGRAGPVPGEELGHALRQACADLALQMAADAEGATKLVRVSVQGARTDEEARRAARRVAESQLVKCSLYGADPYWGRVVSELGSAGCDFDLERVSVAYGGVTVCRQGVAADHDRAAVAAHLEGRQVELSADLALGMGSATIFTTDLTHAYIDENMRTS